MVGPGHTFAQPADAINRAVACWDLSHLHEFELPDGRRIGFPDDKFASELSWERPNSANDKSRWHPVRREQGTHRSESGSY